MRPPTTPRDAGASDHVGSMVAHFGYTIPIHADPERGLVGARMRGERARNSEGVTSRTVLRRCADPFHVIVPVNAVHHEVSPRRRQSLCYKKSPENKSRASGARCGPNDPRMPAHPRTAGQGLRHGEQRDATPNGRLARGPWRVKGAPRLTLFGRGRVRRRAAALVASYRSIIHAGCELIADTR